MSIILSESVYWTISASIQSNLFFLNLTSAAKKSCVTCQLFKVVSTIYAHEEVLVKGNSCYRLLQSTPVYSVWVFSCICVAQSSVFCVFVILCQPLNIYLLVM